MRGRPRDRGGRVPRCDRPGHALRGAHPPAARREGRRRRRCAPGRVSQRSRRRGNRCPGFQNPTGALMSAETRRRLVRVAQDEDVVLIDDRTHSDLDHGATAPPPLASFDDQANVVTIGSMSKLYWGGLRLGWIRARSSLINRLIEQSRAATSAPRHRCRSSPPSSSTTITTPPGRGETSSCAAHCQRSNQRCAHRCPRLNGTRRRAVRISGYGCPAPTRWNSATEHSRRRRRHRGATALMPSGAGDGPDRIPYYAEPQR